MTSGITPTFVLIGVSLVVWSAAASLSTYLAADFERNHHKEAEQGQVDGSKAAGHEVSVLPGSQDIEEMRKAAAENPADVEAQVQLGYALIKVAREESKAGYLMEAVQIFNKALSIQSEHPAALLGLAALSLQAGVVEKALEFYPRYLAVAPNDTRARADYALALIQAGKMDEAEEALQSILTADPSFLPAIMTLAYKRREEGKIDQALTLANRAKATATTEALRNNIDSFIVSLSTTESTQSEASAAKVPAAPSTVVDERSSPAVRVQKYFSEHSIVGRKLSRVRWDSPTLAVIEVQDFPVEQMPPFAKTQFVNKIQQNFADFSEQITIQLRDAQTDKELLSVLVGKDASPTQ